MAGCAVAGRWLSAVTAGGPKTEVGHECWVTDKGRGLWDPTAGATGD